MTQDGISVQLHIYRIAGRDEGWALEVVDPTGTSTTRDEYFRTDHDAHREFCATMEREGIESFSSERDATVH